MAIVGLVTEKDKDAREYFLNTIFRSKNDSLIKNPFTVKAKLFQTAKELFFVMDITPVYPPVYYFGFILLLPFIIFTGLSYWLLLPLCLISVGLFWSSPFFLFMSLIALKKNGCKAKITILTKKKIIKRLLENGSD